MKNPDYHFEDFCSNEPVERLPQMVIIRAQDGVTEWLADNAITDWAFDLGYDWKMIPYYFNNADDAMLFKLTWATDKNK